MTKRQCFFIPVDQFDENGYIPSMITEDEPGHAPLTGNGPASSPWYWGKTYVEAKAVAQAENERLGLDVKAVAEIIMSSMRASNA